MKFKIDSKNLEKKILLIEKSLEPFINKILVPDPNYKFNGRSKNSDFLINYLNNSLLSFIQKSSEISDEFPDVKLELNKEIQRFKDNGRKLNESSKEFLKEPFNSQKRIQMGNDSRLLLNSVARILALIDMIDLFNISNISETMIKILHSMKSSKTETEFGTYFKNYGSNLKDFLTLTQKFVQDMDESELKNELVSAVSLLTKQSLYIYSVSKTYLKHDKSETTKLMHEQVYKQTKDVIELINGILNNKITLEDVVKNNKADKSSKLNFIHTLQDLETQINDSNNYRESKIRIKLENQLEEAIKKVNQLTKQDLFEDLTIKTTLIEECNSLRLALEDLLKSQPSSQECEIKRNEFIRKNKSIRKQIRKAIIEQFSLINVKPLEDLIDTASLGDKTQLDQKSKLFEAYAHKLIEISQLACFVSNNQEGNEIVELASSRLKYLIPLVLNASRILCSFPNSNEAINNMNLFKNEWIHQLKLLNLAIDDITSINDFMTVSETQILQDINKCIVALNNLNAIEFKYSSNQVIERTNRVCDMVQSEMNNYESCDFTEKITDSVKTLRVDVLNNFTKSVQFASNALESKPIKDPNENEFIDSSRSLYDCIRELRNALLQIPHETSDKLSLLDESEFVEMKTDLEKQEHDEDDDELINNNQINNNNNNNNNNFSQEQQQQISEQLNSLREEKSNFDREVLKWDERSNDIIVLSKQMCVLMMDMTNFTRAKGPYKSVSDLINAAKKISEIGSKLEKLCRNLADDCPESQSKKELIRYLNLIPLFCNQLNIGTKVQENIIDPDSATSLLISSKNLMNTVISVVKCSYVASTKYTSKTDTKKPIVQWKMKPPELKPLINKARLNETANLVRKGSKKLKPAPIKALSEFDI